MDVVEIKVSEQEHAIFTDFTESCSKFKDFCREFFELEDLEAYVLASLVIENLSVIVKENDTFKEELKRNAEYIKQSRERDEYNQDFNKD